MNKIQTLKGFLNWITEDKFCWGSSCSCWDALLNQYASGDEKRQGGCLYGIDGRENFKKDEHKELEKIGFTFEELRDFEFLIRFWDGEKGFIDGGGRYCVNKDSFTEYENGIQYIKEWIAHLESKEYKVKRIYIPVRISEELIAKEPILN